MYQKPTEIALTLQCTECTSLEYDLISNECLPKCLEGTFRSKTTN
jgi:hypothetical protein